MKFGAVPIAQALGATAVHSIRQGGFVLKKGTVIGKAEIEALKAAGISEVVVARMDAGDVGEDEAAARIAAALGGEAVDGDRAFTGRCNLFAASAGVLVVDKDAIDAINRIDEAITFATLPAFKPVVAGEMIGTVKIIPFAVSEQSLSAALKIAASTKPLVRVAPYRIRKVGIVSTLLPGLSEKVDRQDLEDHAGAPGAGRRGNRRGAARHARRRRAAKRDCRSAARRRRACDRVRRVGHCRPARRDPGRDRSRGRTHRAFRHAGRSRQSHSDRAAWRENVARRARLRTLAEGKRIRLGADADCWPGIPVTREDITGMGVGGLLMEIVTRPQPRSEPAEDDGKRVGAILLAAGRSTRMGAENKLLAEIGGKPLVRIAAEEALKSKARPLVVVTGHQHERVQAALERSRRHARAQSGFRGRAFDLAQIRIERAAG